ncbi:hypothetical protein VNI00_001145 [Paramarasmius palmivorus]|uniref:INO80 complex subunit F domain-containing protein n=1 Tax=Paramarasmius palmivorus TaxID=297713 RepID=A0AAW0E606_9AGAR
MSRNPSPVPQNNLPLPPVQSSRSKPKNIPMGITAGAEDVKYQAKYKELKRKVKEIESENDKLHFKVLQAKRNIQRMKVERAILYERLAAVPPSPELNEHQSLPPINPAGNPHLPDHVQPPLNDPNFIRSRVPAPPPPLPTIRQNSGNGGERERDRHLPPPMQLPPMQMAADGHAPPPSPPLPAAHSHERSRSHSSSSRSRQNYHGPGYDTPRDLPPMHHFSPPLAERERERERRRSDLHDLAAAAPVHNHQRLGPGTYINRDDEVMRDRERSRDEVNLRELERERDREEWERERAREREIDREYERERELARQQHSPVTMHRRRPPPMLDGPASASSSAVQKAREREELAAAYSLSSLDRDRDSNTPGSSGSRGDGPSPPVYANAPPGMSLHPVDYHRASTNGRDRKRNVEIDPEERDRDRGSSSRRYHHRADSMEDVRMGP